MHLYHDPEVPGRLDIDRGFYERIAQATGRRRRVHEHIVPIRSGYAWPVKAGCVVRIVFQVTGLDPKHEIYFMEPSPARKGDFFEFFAEIDLLCAISTCPSGDLSKWGWGPDGADPVANCHPIGVEVYELSGDLLEGWKPPEPVQIKSVYVR